jgi:hypothetical protein
MLPAHIASNPNFQPQNYVGGGASAYPAAQPNYGGAPSYQAVSLKNNQILMH